MKLPPENAQFPAEISQNAPFGLAHQPAARQIYSSQGTLTVYPLPKPDGYVRALALDRAGQVWVSSAANLNVLEPETQTWTVYTVGDGMPRSVTPLTIDRQGRLWAGTGNGISVFDGQANDPVQALDTLPLLICVYTRAPRDRCFNPLADYGHCAAKKMDYYGFKLGPRIARSGMITYYPLLPARSHDIQFLEELVENFSGAAPADKGFIDALRQALLQERQGVTVITSVRKNMTELLPFQLRRLCQPWRKRIETVGSQLTERFAIDPIRVRDVWHFQHLIIRKILAHTIGVFLNLQLACNPLDLDGLLA